MRRTGRRRRTAAAPRSARAPRARTCSRTAASTAATACSPRTRSPSRRSLQQLRLRRSRCAAAAVGGLRPGGHQQDQADARTARPPRPHPADGNVAPTTRPATAGPTARWNTGRTTPSTPLAASSWSAGRILRQAARCRPGRRTPPRCPSVAAATAICQIRSCANESEHRDRRHDDGVDGLDDDDDARAGGVDRRPDRRPARRPPGPRPGRSATSDSAVGIVVEFDDLQRHHHGPHALGEDRQRHRRDQQAVLAEPERREHAPAAGGHRLLDLVLRAHRSMVADATRLDVERFSRRPIVDGICTRFGSSSRTQGPQSGACRLRSR